MNGLSDGQVMADADAGTTHGEKRNTYLARPKIRLIVLGEANDLGCRASNLDEGY